MIGRSKRVLISLAALAATAGLLSAAAGAQTRSAAALPPGAVNIECGALIHRSIVTQTNQSFASSTFTDLPGANKTVTVPAADRTRCIAVRFTAATRCPGSRTNVNLCYIRALINNAEINPQTGGTQVIDSDSQAPSAHAFEWVTRVGPGTYVVKLQARGSAAGFTIDDWTFVVETLQ